MTASRLKVLRKTLGLNQDEFGAKIGVPSTTISKYEQGVVKPSHDVLLRIGLQYKVNLNWLIKNSGEIFEAEEFLAKTGTDNIPALRLMKSDNIVAFTQDYNLPAQMIEDINYETLSEKSCLKMAKDMMQPVILDEMLEGVIISTKVFYPNGEIVTKNEIKTNQKLEAVKYKIDNISNSNKKLKFVELAIDSLSDKNALDELKTLIRGIELTL